MSICRLISLGKANFGGKKNPTAISRKDLTFTGRDLIPKDLYMHKLARAGQTHRLR